MKVHLVRFSSIIVIIYLICLVCIYIPLQKTEAREQNGEVHIGTSPSNGFMQVSDMAPGDEVMATLTMLNTGNNDFKYAVSARLDQGAHELFEQLRLTVADQHNVLYDGQLNGLTDVPLGQIAGSDQHRLTFTAVLPRQVGNALQDQSASVAFDFIASAEGAHAPSTGGGDTPSQEGESSGNGTKSGSGANAPSHTNKSGKLPQTASFIINLMMIGLLLISCGVVIRRLRTIL